MGGSTDLDPDPRPDLDLHQGHNASQGHHKVSPVKFNTLAHLVVIAAILVTSHMTGFTMIVTLIILIVLLVALLLHLDFSSES